MLAAVGWGLQGGWTLVPPPLPIPTPWGGGGFDDWGCVFSSVGGYFLTLLNCTQIFLSSHLPPRITLLFSVPCPPSKTLSVTFIAIFKTRS